MLYVHGTCIMNQSVFPLDIVFCVLPDSVLITDAYVNGDMDFEWEEREQKGKEIKEGREKILKN